MVQPLPTEPPSVPRPRIRAARAGRRVFFLFVTAVVVAAAAGVFGPSESTVRASGGGYELEVEYPSVSRSGLAASLAVTVRRPGGFAGPVTLALRSGYFDSFDINGVDPEPVSSTSTAERQLKLFEPPPGGEELVVSFDARAQPGVPFSVAKGSVAVVANGQDAVAVGFQTRMVL